MSVQFKPVLWNRNKIIYDAVLLSAVFIYILAYLRIGPMFQEVSLPLDGAILRMRAFGSCAFLLLTCALCIGPLARIDNRFLPLLYNRRHLGVMTASVASVHASYVLGWYFAFSPVDPYVALLAANTSYGQLLGFPFEAFGVFALVVLLALAFTSHDFWLSFLSPPVWKTLHMGLYFAYGSIVLHIVLGSLQAASDPVFTTVVTICVVAVCSLHLIAVRLGSQADAAMALVPAGDTAKPWVEACKIDDIEDKRAVVVALGDDERVAIFRHKETLSAVSNVCAHQNGPLGEGKIIADCITCPWHGYMYRLADGRSPPPFEEKISTYRLKLKGDLVLLDPEALPPGTYVEPVKLGRRK